MITPLAELGFDTSRLSPHSDLKVLWLENLDREVRRARRDTIKGAMPESLSRETLFATLSAFLINTAGTHARLWREGVTSDKFIIPGSSKKSEGVSIFDPEIEAEYGGDPWKGLSSLLCGTFVWSLKEEQKRLIRLGHNGQINPASILLAQLDTLNLGSATPIEIITQVSEEMEEAVQTSAVTISALYKMVAANLKAHDLPGDYYSYVATEIASHNYGLIEALTKAHPAVNTFIAGTFEEVLERPSEDFLDFFQLEEGPSHTVRMNISGKFLEAILQSVTRTDFGERRVCPASEIFIDSALIPPQWIARNLNPLTQDMNDVAFETVALIYQQI